MKNRTKNKTARTNIMASVMEHALMLIQMHDDGEDIKPIILAFRQCMQRIRIYRKTK